MFNIGMMELILILLVAFLVVGPKDLPKVARWIARQVKSLRKLVREVRKEIGWDAFAAEFKDTKEDVERTFREADISGEINQAARDVKDAVGSVQKDVKDAVDEVRSENM